MNKSKHQDSQSLWNCTLSPGWDKSEVQILKQALMYYGIGKWQKILKSQCLPGKYIGQIYIQTQRLLGQQSLGDFMGLRIDIDKVFIDNMKKKDVKRKNGCIINTGDNPTKQERQKNIEMNREKYKLSEQSLKSLKKPKKRIMGVSHFLTLDEIEKKAEKMTTIDILDSLLSLKKEIQRRIKSCEQKNLNYYAQSQDTQGNESDNQIEEKMKLKRKGKFGEKRSEQKIKKKIKIADSQSENENEDDFEEDELSSDESEEEIEIDENQILQEEDDEDEDENQEKKESNEEESESNQKENKYQSDQISIFNEEQTNHFQDLEDSLSQKDCSDKQMYQEEEAVF